MGATSSLQSRRQGLEGLSRPGEATSPGPGPPPVPFPSPVLEQPRDFLLRERPRLIHPGGFWGDIPTVRRPPPRRAVGGGSSQSGAPGFCPENRSLGPRGGGRKGVSSLGWVPLFPLPETSVQLLIPTPHLLWGPTPPPSPIAVCNACMCLHHRCTSVFRPMCLCVHGVNMRVQVSVLKLISVDTCLSMYVRAQVNISLSFCVKGMGSRHLCTGECVLRVHVCVSLSAWTTLCTRRYMCRCTYGPRLCTGILMCIRVSCSCACSLECADAALKLWGSVS